MKGPFQKDKKLDLSTLGDWPRKVKVSGNAKSKSEITFEEFRDKGVGEVLVAAGVK